MVHGYVHDLEQHIFQWGCNLATHCSIFVQLCLRKTHLFSGVEGSIQSVTDAKREGLGAGQQCTLTILNCRSMMAKQSLFLPANSVLLQVLKTIWQTIFFAKVDIMFWSNYLLERHWHFPVTVTDNSIAHKLADMTQSAGAILLSSLPTQFWRSFFELQSIWCIVFWSYLFSAEMRSSQYLLLCWCSAHCQVQLSVQIFHLGLSTWRLPIDFNLRWEHNPLV